jgi:hypothetical protein
MNYSKFIIYNDIIMSLSDSQIKTFKKAMKYEKDGVIQFLKDINNTDLDLYDLQDESVEEKVKDLLKKLYRDNCSQKGLVDTLEEKTKDFRKKYDEDLIYDSEVQSKDLFGLDHVNFEWSKQMIKEAKKEEDQLNKSKKLKTWEHSYKKAIEEGVDIRDLDESIKELISKHLRTIKSGSRKKKTKKKKKKKKKKRTKSR